MVDIWTTQNDDKLDAQNAAYDEKLKQARQLELDREQAALEKQLNEKRRHEKQEMLRNELQQQINELSKYFNVLLNLKTKLKQFKTSTEFINRNNVKISLV